MISLLFGTIGAKSLELLERWGYGGAFFWSAMDRITISLIPTEVLLPLYGFLIGKGAFSFLPMFLVISLGALVGEIVIYLIFAKFGRAFVERYGKYFLVSKHDLAELDRLFEKYGSKVVFWGRFLPVARAIIAIPAGISRLDIRRFSLYSFFGMLPYNLAFIFLGKKTGENFDRFRPYFDIAEKIGLAALLIFIAWYVYRHLNKKHLSHG